MGGRLHAAFEDFWPPVPKGIMENQRVRDLPWPPCWRQHPGLVEDLVALKAWHDALLLAAGNESAAKSWMEWTSTVQHLLVPRVQRLARYCQNGHREPARASESRLTDGGDVPEGRAQRVRAPGFDSSFATAFVTVGTSSGHAQTSPPRRHGLSASCELRLAQRSSRQRRLAADEALCHRLT